MKRMLLLAALALALPAAAWAATLALDVDTLTVVEEPVRIEISTVDASVTITPSTLQRGSTGHRLKAHVDLPDAFDARTVPVETVFLCTLGSCVGADSVSSSEHHMEAIFDGDDVLAVVPNGDVTLRVSGAVGTPPATWSGTDTIRVKETPDQPEDKGDTKDDEKGDKNRDDRPPDGQVSPQPELPAPAEPATEPTPEPTSEPVPPLPAPETDPGAPADG